MVIRYKYIINAKFQIKYVLLTTFMLLILAVLFYFVSKQQISNLFEVLVKSGVVSELLAKKLLVLQQKNFIYNLMISFMGALIVVLTFVTYFTHKVAGPMYRLSKIMHKITHEGIDSVGVVKFRKNDEFQNIAHDFSLMIDSIKRRQEYNNNKIFEIISVLNTKEYKNDKVLKEVYDKISKIVLKK